IDTLPLDNLTNKIYFKLCALDYHYNSSPLTPFIEVKKPDRMPPSIPVFYKVLSTASGVDLRWNNSNSSDVVAHVLYRKMESDTQWMPIARFDTVACPKGKPCRYFDQVKGKNDEKNNLLASNKLWYQYSVRALDESGNYSPFSEIVRAKPLDLKVAEGISDIQYAIDREAKFIRISWKHPSAIRVLIYRKRGDEPLYHYHTVENKDSFTDPSPQLNTAYSYRLRGILSDGSLTPFSETIQVNY
ncbi:MAG: hypothetical protein K2Q22_07185, partial [Cytophagales bacterium]|nr:hypothetical protein [Cytophagales bacterium]